MELQGDAPELGRTEIASEKYRLVHANAHTGQGPTLPNREALRFVALANRPLLRFLL